MAGLIVPKHVGWSDTPQSYSLHDDVLLHETLERLYELGSVATVQDSVRCDTADAILSVRGWKPVLLATDLQSKNYARALVYSEAHDTHAVLTWQGGSIGLYVVGNDHARALRACLDLRQKLPEPTPLEDERVRVRFWALGNNGPVVRVRTVDVHAWEKISRNYAAASRPKLDGMMRWNGVPDAGGKLVVLHGPPGTGKTNLIRALAWEWRHWCHVDYVVDSESFFGGAEYMLSVLLDTDDETPEAGPAPTRLIVVEDADELISVDAKRQSGQSVSRLLNLCDGMVGQGLNVVIMLTTNEQVKNLHPAIIRPGRCIANLHLGEFTRDEARTWLNDPAYAGEHPTLAELYELHRRAQVNVPKKLAEVGGYL